MQFGTADQAILVGILGDGDHRCARRVGRNRCRVGGHVGLVAGGVGHLRGRLELGAIGRRIEFDNQLARINLRLDQGDRLGGIAGGIDRDQVASNRILRQGDLDTNRPLEFGGVDEAVVVLIFGDDQREILKRGQVNLGKVGAGTGLVAGRIEDEGADVDGTAVGRHREVGGDKTVGLVGRGHHDVAGNRAVGDAHGITHIDLVLVEFDADIGRAIGFGAVDEAVVVGVVGDEDVRRHATVRNAGVDLGRVATDIAKVASRVADLCGDGQGGAVARIGDTRQGDGALEDVGLGDGDGGLGDTVDRRQQGVASQGRRREGDADVDQTLQFGSIDVAVVVDVFVDVDDGFGRCRQLDACGVLDRTGIIASRVGDRCGHLEVGVVRRRVELGVDEAGSNLRRRQREHLVHVADRRHRQRVANRSTLRDGDANIDVVVLELGDVDEAIVVGIFGDTDTQTGEFGDIDGGAGAARRRLVAGGVENEGGNVQLVAVGGHVEAGGDKTVNLVGSADDDIAGGGAVGDAHRIADLDVILVEGNADIGRAVSFGAIDETVAVGILDDGDGRRQLVVRNARVNGQVDLGTGGVASNIAGRDVNLGGAFSKRLHRGNRPVTVRTSGGLEDFTGRHGHRDAGAGFGGTADGRRVVVGDTVAKETAVRRGIELGLDAGCGQVDARTVAANAAKITGIVADLGGNSDSGAVTRAGNTWQADALVGDIGSRQGDRRLSNTVDRDQQGAAGDRSRREADAGIDVALQLGGIDPAVAIAVFGQGDDRCVGRRQLDARAVADRAGTVASGIGDRGIDDEIGIVGRGHEGQINETGANLGCGQGDRLGRVAAGRDGQRVAGSCATGQGDADIDVPLEFGSVDEAVVVLVFAERDGHVGELGGINGQRQVGLAEIADGVGGGDFDLGATVGQRLRRRDLPVAVAIGGGGELLAGTRDDDGDPGTGIAATGQGRGVVVGQVVALGAAVGSRVKLNAESGRSGADGRRIGGDVGLVASGVGHLGGHVELGAVGRRVEFENQLARINLRLRQGNGLSRIAGGIDGDQIACDGILGQGDLDADGTVEFAGVDEAVVVLIFGQGNNQALKRGQVDLGEVGTGIGLVARWIEQEGFNGQTGAIGGHRETGGHKTIGLVGRGDDDVAGGGAIGGTNGIANLDQSTVEFNADIGIALGFNQVNKAVVVGIVGDEYQGSCATIGRGGIGNRRSCRQIGLFGWQIENSEIGRGEVIDILPIDGFDHAQELDEAVTLGTITRLTRGRRILFDDVVRIEASLQGAGQSAGFLRLGEEGAIFLARRRIGRHFGIHGNRFAGTDSHVATVSENQRRPTALTGDDALAFHDRVALAQTTNRAVGTPGEHFSGNVGNLGNGLGHDLSPVDGNRCTVPSYSLQEKCPLDVGTTSVIPHTSTPEPFASGGDQQSAHFLQSLGLDLPNALSGNVEFCRQVMQGRCITVVQPASLDDPPTTRVEGCQGGVQTLVLEAGGSLVFEDAGRLVTAVGQIIDRREGILAVIRIAFKGEVAAGQTGFHLDHFFLLDAQAGCHLTGLAAGQRIDAFVIGLQAAQIEEQLALGFGRGDLDQAPVLEDVLVDFGLDPVHGERHQANATRRIEAFDRLHQADVAFLDQVGMRQAIAEVTTGDGNDETQVRKDELTRGIDIAVIAETLGQPRFFRLGQHRVTIRRLNVGVDVAND